MQTRLLNCDLTTPDDVVIEILNNFVKKLVTSGFKKIKIATIIRNGVISYLKSLAKHKLSIRNIHNPTAHGMHLRRINKVIEKNEWFRKTRDQNEEVDIGLERGVIPKWRGSLKRDRKAKTI